MKEDSQRFRWLATRLPSPDRRRIVVLTGARQTGKTTLARAIYPKLRYLNLDAIEERERLRELRTAAWGRTVGHAVLDEAQKEPTVFDKVKYAYDAAEIDFTVLLGSSRFLLLERVRESLAGRAFVFELWPLVASEVRSPVNEPPLRPLFDRLLDAGPIRPTLEEEPATLFGADDDARRSAVEHLAAWGGMPELLRLTDSERFDWLRSYEATFLERDLLDLARLSDLRPFHRLGRIAMLRSGQLLNVADLARDIGVSPSTARRYLDYLVLSFQIVLLPPYRRNLTSAAVKTPKLFATDLGILRQATGQWGPPIGALFETFVVAEAWKWLATMGRDARLSFYRTRSGLEVDLVVETSDGVLGIEVKSRERLDGGDCRPLAAVADALGPQWRGGLVVYSGDALTLLDETRGIWAMPLHRLF